MRNTTYNKVKSFFKVFSGFIIAVPLLIAGAVQAATMYSSGSLLQPSDVTSSHIRDNTIVNADISTSAAILINKTQISNTAGPIPFAGSGGTATSTDLSFSTSTRALTVGDLVISQGTTTIRSIQYTWPSADGTANQALKTSGAGVLSWGTVSASQIVSTMTAGNDSVTGNALFIASSTAYTKQLFDANVATSDNGAVGNTSSNTRNAQSFTESTSYPIGEITLKLSKTGTPTDNLILAVQADSAGVPSGIDLATASIAGASLTGSAATTTLTLSTEVVTTAGSKYWLVLSRSGANDAVNYFIPWVDQSSPTYANGNLATYDGSTWSQVTSTDLEFILKLKAIAGRVYATDADFYESSMTFIGFANGTGTPGSSLSVVVGGVITGLSGLTTGVPYYLSNTEGAISTTAGTNSKKVGGALSATTLLIQNTW